MAATGKPVHPLWTVAGAAALTAMFVTAALVIVQFRWPGMARFLAAVATAAVGAGACLTAYRFCKRLERAGERPRLAAFLRHSGAGLVFAGMIATQAVVLRSLIGALAVHGYMLPVFLGAGLLAAGHTRRIGKTRHCPGCEYEFGFADESAAPIRCPECGTGWLGRLATGRRVRSVRMMAGGAAIIALVPALMFGQFASLGISKLMPTPVLVVWLSATGTHDGAAWGELLARGMTKEQEAWLARRLLDRREARGRRVGGDAGEWLEAAVVGGTLPPEVAARFYEGIFTADLDLPRDITAGRPFWVGLRDLDECSELKYKCYVYIGGFGVDDGPASAGRGNEGYYPGLIDSGYYAQRGNRVGAELVLPEPGKHTIRAELWVSVQGGFPAVATWNNDGTPNLPSGRWLKRVILEREVVVDP